METKTYDFTPLFPHYPSFVSFSFPYLPAGTDAPRFLLVSRLFPFVSRFTTYTMETRNEVRYLGRTAPVPV